MLLAIPKEPDPAREDLCPGCQLQECDCLCEALPCEGALGEKCGEPKPMYTMLRNPAGKPECAECFAKRRRARCWR